MSSNRTNQFKVFAGKVEEHIENYTVKQYGDAPHDQLSTATRDDVVYNIKRYVARLNTGCRGRVEAKRDVLKLAHYLQVLYSLMEEEERDVNEFNSKFIQDFAFALRRVEG